MSFIITEDFLTMIFRSSPSIWISVFFSLCNEITQGLNKLIICHSLFQLRALCHIGKIFAAHLVFLSVLFYPAYSPPYFPSLFLSKAEKIFAAVTRFLPPAYCSIISRLLTKCQKTGLHSRLAEYILPDPKYHSIQCPYHFPPLCYCTSSVLWTILRRFHYIPPFSYNFNQQLRTWQYLHAHSCMTFIISYACMNSLEN